MLRVKQRPTPPVSIQATGKRAMLTFLARVLHHPLAPLLLLVLANAVFYISIASALGA